MAERHRFGALAPAVLTAAVLALSGCGKDDLAAKFSGGSSSKDKQPIASTVQTAGAAQPGTPVAPAPAGAVVAQKTDAPAGQQLADGEPIRDKQMKYRSSRNRDPFRSLIGDGEDRADLVDLSVVKLVGIVQGPDPFCTVEDAEGIAYVLRKGDRVKNGRVVAIKSDRVVASQTLLGYTTTVQLKLEEGKESHG